MHTGGCTRERRVCGASASEEQAPALHASGRVKDQLMGVTSSCKRPSYMHITAPCMLQASNITRT